MKNRHDFFHAVLLVLIALVFIGIVYGIVRGKGSNITQEEFTMKDGQKVTCFTSFIGRMPTMNCIPHKDSKNGDK